MHNIAAILCLIVAFVLATFLFDEWRMAPGWVSGLSVVATIVMVVSAVRLYTKGARRRQKIEGPRTKIVLADISQPPPPSPPAKARHSTPGK